MSKVTISQAEYAKFKAQEELLEKLKLEKEALASSNEQLKKEKASLENNIQFLAEQLVLLRKSLYAPKSERAQYLNQIKLDDLFDEIELFSDQEVEELNLDEPTDTLKVSSYTRKKRRNLTNKVPEGLPVVERHHYVDELGRVCPVCNANLEEIGTETRRTLGIAPAKAFVILDVIHVYACKACEEKAEPVTVVKGEMPAPVIPGGIASPEAIANIIHEKFVQGTPLYRQEQYWKHLGLELSRQTMSNWLLKSAELYLSKIYDRLHEDLVKEDILHADETEVQVLREEGKSPQSRSYMWLYRTGGRSPTPIVLYKYERDRRHARPEDFLAGFSGYLHSDGYEAYHKLEGVTSVGCFAHVRRKFVEAAEAAPKGAGKQNLATRALDYIKQIFAWEDSFSELDPEERYQKRLDKEKPVMDKFFSFVEGISVADKSALGKARTYALSQKPYILNLYQDGRLELTNNRAERSIKPFVIGRKNFLFANTPSGAQTSAIIYSLVETAKETGVDPYQYFTYTLQTAAQLAAEGKEDEIAKLTPAYFKALNSKLEDK